MVSWPGGGGAPARLVVIASSFRAVFGLVIGPEGYQFVRGEVADMDRPQRPTGQGRPGGRQHKGNKSIIESVLPWISIITHFG